MHPRVNSFIAVPESSTRQQRRTLRYGAVPVLAFVSLGIVGCTGQSQQPAASSAQSAQAPEGGQSPFATAPAGQQPTEAAPSGQLPAGHPTNVFTGAIVESMDAAGYTYARLKSDTSEIWIAGPLFKPASGEVVSVALDMPMENFESKTLKRTFPMLYFVADVARNGQPARSNTADAPTLATSHGAPASAAPANAPTSAAPAVAKLAPPPGGIAIADLFARKASLGTTKVTVRGTVVKYNGGILDRNWLHIQDGSGSADQHTNDLAVTTTDVAKVGDVVTVTGVVGLNRDFTAGYSYDVMLENASLVR